MEEGTREAVREEKRHALDFALWKRNDGPSLVYDSPWGKGRPGWHIECSAMANTLLGPRIDIHAGGLDLLFPHHENELAQCEAHNDQPFVNYWMHLGLLLVEGTKMSKSLGNFVTVAEAIARYGAPLLILAIMKYHYRTPMNFSAKLFDDSLNQLTDLYWILERLEGAAGDVVPDMGSPAVEELRTGFRRALDNDFATPEALVALAEAAKRGRVLLREGKLAEMAALAATMRKVGSVLLLFDERFNYERVLAEALRFRSEMTGHDLLSVAALTSALEARMTARNGKDFRAADQVRESLSPYGITILDGDPKGWRFDSVATAR
jgi:cysteinyl-tRNA synthetase